MENDELLERALATYAGAEPRPGLEQRVIARVFSEPARPRFRWLRWAWAVPALAGAVVAVLSIPRTPAPPQAPRPPAAVVPVASAAPVPARPAIHRRHRAAQPKPRLFPTPSPLTAEERLLVAF